MQLKFCGADREVTGSCHLLTLDDGFTILLDCGLYQGHVDSMDKFNETWLFDPVKIDCVVLSHAHIDHCGRLPRLVKDGFKGPIYSTHGTRSLCAILLLDSAKIQELDAQYELKRIQKKKLQEPVPTPLYTSHDVTATMDRFISFGYERWISLRPGVDVLFRDAGHILGSASVVVRINENGKETLVGFTGDIGRPARPILRDPIPMMPVDYLICESTYGDRLHPAAPEETEKLLSIIHHTCVEKKGKLIIPAFSVGRTQELVYMLDKASTAGILPPIPVFVDSPLAVSATQVYGSHPECFDNELNEYLLTDPNPFGFNNLTYIRDVEDSKQLNFLNGPCIIISASGMMNAGRVRHHLANNIEDPNATFLIVGYCAPDTPGGMLKAGI
ncbi:MAG: MBL fold metallo-hydrolase, partial [Saprospiraceae bacterium]